jgi:hypothetical protein
MSRLRTLLALGLGSLLLSGCSLVPTASSPQRLSRNQIPFGLLGKTIPGTNGGRVRFITQPVYIVDVTGHLAPSSRIVPSPPVLLTVLRQLILGPTEIEKAAGYSSALPQSLVVISAVIKNSVGYIELATPLSALPRSQQVLAAGQLVLTANDAGASNFIEISVGGAVQATLLPDGQRATRVSVSDFQKLLNR